MMAKDTSLSGSTRQIVYSYVFGLSNQLLIERSDSNDMVYMNELKLSTV